MIWDMLVDLARLAGWLFAAALILTCIMAVLDS